VVFCIYLACVVSLVSCLLVSIVGALGVWPSWPIGFSGEAWCGVSIAILCGVDVYEVLDVY
jgi:hypothetical protein